MYPDTAADTFVLRHGEWRRRLVHQGPGAAFPYAWRLPELARNLERPQRLVAALALARTLFGLGRFGDCHQALEATPTQPGDAPLAILRHAHLAIRCRRVTGQAWATPPAADPDQAVHLDIILDTHYLLDDAPALGVLAPRCRAAALSAGDPARAAWAALLMDWAGARCGETGVPGAGLRALAVLARHHPTRAALGEGIHAHAAFLRDPASALSWLDQALLAADRQGQHQDQARLLYLKSLALAADGQLADADRFLKLARETAKRQGAWRWLEDMAA